MKGNLTATQRKILNKLKEDDSINMSNITALPESEAELDVCIIMN